MSRPPLVMSNVVLFQYTEGKLLVILTSEGNTASKSTRWQLPAAYVSDNQTSLGSLEKTLRQTIGLRDSDVNYREQLYTNEYLSADQSLVCISYMYLSRDARWYKGAQSVSAFGVDQLPNLPKEDLAIIRYARSRLHSKILYSSIIAHLLPKTFDLTQLQLAFETITEQAVDRRNFRKKMTQLNVIELADKPKPKAPSTANPQLYRFISRDDITIYSRPFLSK